MREYFEEHHTLLRCYRSPLSKYKMLGFVRQFIVKDISAVLYFLALTGDS